MPDNINTLPAIIHESHLVERAGTNIPRSEIEFEGEIWTLPAQYTNRPFDAPVALQATISAQFEMIDASETYFGYTPDEVAVALQQVLGRIGSGVSTIQGTRYENPSVRMISCGYDWATRSKIEVSVTDGWMSIPGFWGEAKIRVVADNYDKAACTLKASVARSEQGKLNGLFGLVHDQADQHSIYLGQIIDTNFKFLDRTGVDPAQLAMSNDMKWAFDTYVRAPLQYSDSILAKKKDPKTGILLIGPPGGGKTVTVEAIEWTVGRGGGCGIHMDPSLGLAGLVAADRIASRLCSKGHLSLITIEDMEKLGEYTEGDRAQVLEILDGADTKRQRRIMVGTTNFLEKMETTTYRAGRFSTVIECGLPDRSQFEQLVRLIVDDDDLDETIDFDRAFAAFEGYTYAFIANAANSMFLHASVTHKGNLDDFKITTDDLIAAGEGQHRHFKMMSHVPVKEMPSVDQSLRQILADQIEAIGDVTEQAVSEIEVSTDYDTVYEAALSATDSVVESRLDGARIEDERGKGSTINTN